MEETKTVINKSGKFYVVVLCLWSLCLCVLGYCFYRAILSIQEADTARKVSAIVILSFTMIFIGFSWLVSVKDLCSGIMTFFLGKRVRKLHSKLAEYQLNFSEENPAPKVVLVYCTCDDFVPIALERSMQQDYINFETVILDDSRKQENKDKIDEFAKEHNVTVVRREEKKHYKAGNINNYLKGKEDYDYFVVLDADEIIPPSFIEKALKYFYCFSDVGIVQAEHTAWNNRNAFMSVFSACMGLMVVSGGYVSQFYAQNTFYGHGAMISKKAFDDVGGFPHVVGEDSGLTINMLKSNYSIYHAGDIVCYEEHPVNFPAYKKRHRKFVTADFEVSKTYSKSVSKMKNIRWFQRLDIHLWLKRLSLLPVFAFLTMLAFLTLAWLGVDLQAISFAVMLFLVFLISPLFITLITHIKKVRIVKLTLYLILSLFLYTSLIILMVTAITTSTFGIKARFVVTPKQSEKFSLLYCVFFNIIEILWAGILSFTSWLLTGSVVSILFVVIALLSTVLLTYMSNIRVKNRSLEKIKTDIAEFKVAKTATGKD